MRSLKSCIAKMSRDIKGLTRTPTYSDRDSLPSLIQDIRFLQHILQALWGIAPLVVTVTAT
jgi:hypothetical protein